MMEFSHIFYKELPLDEDNIFLANLTENNEVEQSFKKSNLYTVSGLSIDQDTASNVSLPNVEGKKALSDILRVYVEEKNKFNPDLKIYKEDYFDITVLPFVKRTKVLINGFKYYDTTTQKEETIEFYNYYNRVKNFGFTSEHLPLEFKYEITLSSDKKTLTKKLQWAKQQGEN